MNAHIWDFSQDLRYNTKGFFPCTSMREETPFSLSKMWDSQATKHQDYAILGSIKIY